MKFEQKDWNLAVGKVAAHIFSTLIVKALKILSMVGW